MSFPMVSYLRDPFLTLWVLYFSPRNHPVQESIGLTITDSLPDHTLSRSRVDQQLYIYHSPPYLNSIPTAPSPPDPTRCCLHASV